MLCSSLIKLSLCDSIQLSSVDDDMVLFQEVVCCTTLPTGTGSR
jgi:hypothetical protein